MTEQQPPCIFPALRFGNANRMVDWLQEAFGFRLHACHKADDGSIAHAELALGTSMIMVGQSRDDAFSKIVGEPNGPGGKTLYVAVADVDTAFRRAETAGATIVEQLTERDYGSREFVCLDPEENVWCFGTYWPTAAAG
ncbi:VOC family protein [Stappia sp. MMSF_3263]|uniref:VOC family protein n=1 Tax=Stappia sp. MMSF_3263 TaxID=3046693 RepID=UPI00273D309A|nr:VOC family protein [Stappia sp. MMSF_3263]